MNSGPGLGGKELRGLSVPRLSLLKKTDWKAVEIEQKVQGGLLVSGGWNEMD